MDADRDRATVLLLGPVAIIIVMFLGAICVDQTAWFLTRRTLSDVAAAAANDAVSIGFDATGYTTSVLVIDERAIAQIARSSVASHRSDLPADPVVEVQVQRLAAAATPFRVVVTVTVNAPGIVLPGSTTLRASAAATATLSG